MNRRKGREHTIDLTKPLDPRLRFLGDGGGRVFCLPRIVSKKLFLAVPSNQVVDISQSRDFTLGHAIT